MADVTLPLLSQIDGGQALDDAMALNDINSLVAAPLQNGFRLTWYMLLAMLIYPFTAWRIVSSIKNESILSNSLDIGLSVVAALGLFLIGEQRGRGIHWVDYLCETECRKQLRKSLLLSFKIIWFIAYLFVELVVLFGLPFLAGGAVSLGSTVLWHSANFHKTLKTTLFVVLHLFSYASIGMSVLLLTVVGGCLLPRARKFRFLPSISWTIINACYSATDGAGFIFAVALLLFPFQCLTGQDILVWLIRLVKPGFFPDYELKKVSWINPLSWELSLYSES